MAYYVGSLVQLSVLFTNVAGVPSDPTTVTVVVTAPDGTQVTYSSPTHTGTGTYTQNVPSTQVGSYNYEWFGTGAIVAVQPGTFQSYPVPIASTNSIDFVTLMQLKDWIESMPETTSVDDSILSKIITSVSQDILNRMSRNTIFSTDYPEWYDGTGSATLALDNWPINSVATLRVYGVDTPPSADHIQNGYIISRDKKFLQLVGGGSGLVPGFGFGGSGISSAYGRRCGNVFPQGIGNVYVVYNSGFTSVPSDLAEACLLIIDQDYKRRGWVDRAQIAIPQGGGTTTYRSWSIPPRAQEIIDRYTRTYHP